MPKASLSWGLLSTARINRALIPTIRASKRSRLVAVASRSQDQANAYASIWKIPKAYGSYEDMLADPEIDVVYNSLPNGLHALWTVKALQAGKHVLCEKPLAVTLEEVDAIQQAAQKAGRVVQEAFMYRHHPQTLKVKELVERGVIGQLQLVRGAFTYFLTHEADVRLDHTLVGGSIWDVGCYPVSYARYIFGAEPVEVFGWKVKGASQVDESFYGQMHFPGDVFAQVDSGFRSQFRSFIEIVGNEGTLSIPAPFQPGYRTRITLSRGAHSEKIAVRGEELYRGEVENMADAILLGKPPRVSLEDSRGNVAAILALLRSADLGNPVRLSDLASREVNQ